MLKVKSTKPAKRTKAARRLPRPRTRRTTISLPEELHSKLEQFAIERHQTLSSAIAYLVQDALRSQSALARPNPNIWQALQRSFSSLTEEEQMLVDGIILSEPFAESE